jgi:hypothetical protein
MLTAVTPTMFSTATILGSGENICTHYFSKSFRSMGTKVDFRRSEISDLVLSSCFHPEIINDSMASMPPWSGLKHFPHVTTSDYTDASHIMTY